MEFGVWGIGFRVARGCVVVGSKRVARGCVVVGSNPKSETIHNTGSLITMQFERDGERFVVALKRGTAATLKK